MRLVIVLTCLLLFVGCEQSKPDPPELRRASVEDKAASNDDNDKRAEVWAAAREFISRAFPDWKLNGLSTLRYSENSYYAFGDISKGDERRTVDLSVRLFVEDNEHTYWKVEHSPNEGEQHLPIYVIRPYQQ
jgi:hypothetical protein